MNLKDKIKEFPILSGVYLMKNKEGQIIYVGKAVNLRKRVQSYFRHNEILSKTSRLVLDIDSIDYIETNSEAEALILEASLIKKYQPKYNIDLRDDKSYPFIEITKEDFPRIAIVRPRIKKEKALYYGPYTNPLLIRKALDLIRKIFHFCVCRSFPKKECFDYHLGLCDAPCVGRIGKKDYHKIIKNIRLILEGKKDRLIQELRKEMENLSKEKKFEEAGKIRDQLQALGALFSGTKDVNYYKEAEQIQRVLNLPKAPVRIEAFDISNIMGAQAVGSMVSFLDGKPDKSNYRRFKIKQVTGIDDFKMIGEVVRRRYSRLKDDNMTFPDLILIDGGKGQLKAAYQELKGLNVDIPIISLAKREEEVFVPFKQSPIILSKDSLGLKLLQRVRDEAHRFAVKYHRALRSRNVFS